MINKYQNRYRVQTLRLKHWDYGLNAAYFLTICTNKRLHYFGEINAGEMHLSPIGQIAKDIWNKIPNQFPFIKLGEFIIMPNHIHGIIIINNPDRRDAINRVSKPQINRVFTTQVGKTTGGITGQHNPMLSTNNLSKICRWFKGRTTYESRKIHMHFSWQPRFYEHIIRNNKAYQNITNYIINNPKNWSNNRFRSG